MTEFRVTSLETEELKQSLIDFVKSYNEFSDANYDGSAINTLIDLLVRNAQISSYQANMIANESFLQSAQIRGNASSHAQKLSYTPRSRTGARLVCDIKVNVPSQPQQNSITAKAGTDFLRTIGGNTYSFTNLEDITLFYDLTKNAYTKENVELIQGQRIINQFVYDPQNTSKIIIPNPDIDTSTLKVYILDAPGSQNRVEFLIADDITDMKSNNKICFIGEDKREQYYIEFGKNIMGLEPESGSIVRLEYLETEDNHANGIKKLVAGSSIEGYSDIEIIVTTQAYGGFEKATIEEIKFIAPRAYQSQNRAVKESDYEVEIKKQFPFVKSVQVWGGEKNEPPAFGTVFISIISDENIFLTRNLKREIEEYIDGKNVTAIIPKIVEPDYINVDLEIDVIKNNKVSKSFAQIQSTIVSRAENYRDELLSFGKYYNEADFIRLLKNDNAIDALDIRKTFNITKKSFENKEKKYIANFRNNIKKGSVLIENMNTTTSQIEKVFDDENGNIIRQINEINKIIGTVDYEKGKIEITIINIGIEDLLFTAEPDGYNIFSNFESVLRINAPKIKQVLKG